MTSVMSEVAFMMCRTTYFEIFTGFFSSALCYFEKEKGIAAQGYSLKNVVGIFFFAFPSDPKIHHEWLFEGYPIHYKML